MSDFLSPFLVSFGAVGLAEIGDKTQLLAMMLAARTRKPMAVTLGIALAALLNNGMAAALGQWGGLAVDEHILRWIVAASLIGMAVWMLLPHKEEEPHLRKSKFGAFGTAFLSFFLAELADKTQIATLTLATRYAEYFWVVALGATAGMMAANVPAIIFGEAILKKIPARLMHYGAAALYAVMGVFALLSQ